MVELVELQGLAISGKDCDPVRQQVSKEQIDDYLNFLI
jgi:hypothetical protein